jgi:F0F1-type ATP synthase membrane subunit c/vacuolar-type H+-ATPase subunit K
VAQVVELDIEEDDAVELTVEVTVELLVGGISEDVVTIGAGAALGEVIVVVRVIVVGSLQPNHPGVLQEEVVIVLVMVVVGVLVVVSSRQPHQPGVLQVSVRVCEVVLEGLLVLLVVVSLLLLSKNFQLKQS